VATTSGIRGRFFATLLDKALRFYERHSTTINPIITTAAVAAIQTLLDELPGIILALNPRGPQ
jgi:hypothetical protein